MVSHFVKRNSWLYFVAALILAFAAILFCRSSKADSPLSFQENDTYGVIMGASGEKVFLYSSENTESDVVAAYLGHDWFAVTGETQRWLHVEMMDGKCGYLLKRQVDVASTADSLVGVVTNPEETSLLNLRAKPDRRSFAVAQFESGIPCLILSKSGEWYHVNVNGLDGYFHSDYITAYTQPAGNSLATVACSLGGSAQLLSGPGDDFANIAELSNGDVVMLLEAGDNYWQISFRGMSGFVNADNIRYGIVPTENLPADENIAVAATENCEIHVSASSNSQIAEVALAGRNIVVFEKGTEWCMVKTSSERIGYAKTASLNFSSDKLPTKSVYHPDSTFVNLRNAPDLKESTVLEKVPHGSSVTVLVPGIEWTKVSYKNRTGYMMSAYLR